MFDNPEKLFILLIIALLIFGPSKLVGLGGTIGKTIREFRSAVRGAQETFTSEMQQSASELEAPSALPAPDAPSPAAAEIAPAWEAPSSGDAAVPGESAAPAAPAPAGVSASQPEGRSASDLDQSSLASEPTAEALRKSLSGRG